ncbi:amino acid adenylation domain-containing protein [Rhodococcus sp. OK519]|uniref:non-ribosomal peptide synthetase n=1 Tax=Rhodococcus sp. OK519 TaxID=2135729 RepID=UPI000D3C4F81|nr:amino acid adenylation domain-containing protein [Rhodococcus sp. OK519]
MAAQQPGVDAFTIEDLPRLLAGVVEVDPERIALTSGDTTVTYAHLKQEIETLDAAMGGVLGIDALVPVVLSTVAPGLLETPETGGLSGLLSALFEDAAAVLGDSATAGPSAEPAATLVSLFDEQVARTPDAVALEFDGVTLTYAQFDARANRLARHLISLGVGPDSLVGLGIRRSLDLLVGMYAIVKAGGAYVPLDPDHPADRLGYVLDIARPVAILTTTRDGLTLDTGTPILKIDEIDLQGHSGEPIVDADRRAPLSGDNLAYVIFTSGSTGRPKGVAVGHGAIVANLRWRQHMYPMSGADVVLQKTPFTFDVSVWEFFWPLQAGARLVIAAPDGHRDPAYLARVMVERGVTVAHFVPSMLSVFVTEPTAATVTTLQNVFASGEALPPQTAARFRAISGAALHNLYGPTEAAVDVTFHEVTADDEATVPIGAAVADTDLYVLDEGLRRVPAGTEGELYLAGVQLARGYLQRPDLTADRFVADPYGAPGDRMYRTGDLVKVSRSGELEYIGRTDFQVKLRGLRIELGEIESALLGHPAVSQSVVVVHSDADLGDHLVAYLVTDGGADVDRHELAAAVSARLPEYMVPSLFVALAEFPLNASGKLDRKALPAPDFSSLASEYRAPGTPTEETLAATFADVLGTDRIGVDDDYFALGGNSLSATRVVARINADLGIRIDVRDFFDAPTVARLAALVDGAVAAGGATRAPLVAQDRPDTVPLSMAQQRMWFLNRFDTDSAANNIVVAIRLTGALDVDALRVAVSDVIERHESLRTVFPEIDGTASQVILPADRVAVDFTAETVSESEVAGAVAETISRGFDVTAAVPFRMRLLAVTPTEHVLVVVVHHISADGFSMGPLTRDIVGAYAARSAGAAPTWAPLAVQYADYALWQRDALGSEDDPESVVAQQVEFWREALADLPDRLDLPMDRPRPVAATNSGASHRFSIDADVSSRIDAIAREHGASTFMVVHAALAVVLARLSGTTDIAIGTPVAGRGEAALDDLVGMFVNTLVLRADVRADRPFADLLVEVRNTDLAAFGNADVPFERLVEVLNPARSQARHPLFQVVLSFQNMDRTELALGDLTVSGVDFDAAVAKFDLAVTVAETDSATGGLDVDLTYATDLFDASTMRTFADRFIRVLDAVTADAAVPVGDIDLLDDAETSALTAKADDGGTESLLLPQILAAAANSDPARTALVSGDDTVTYRDLDDRSSRLARALIARGAGPETVVAVALTRSIESVTAVWAVAKTGAAFVPVDPNYPADRVAHMVSDSRALLGITVAALVGSLPATLPWIVVDESATVAEVSAQSAAPVVDADRVRPLRVADSAYVIYTSGSTGVPKGVVVTHAGLAAFAAEQVERYGIGSDSRTLHFASPSFDASILELLMAFGAGATMVIAPTSIYGGPELAELLRAQQVTHAFVTPAALASVDPAGLDALRTVVVGGEACPPELVTRWAPGRKMFNAYGPTEATVASNISDALVPGEPVTIGRAIRGAAAYVLDARLRPVPAGVPGELYLAGAGVARGYLGRPALTAERFVANPFGEPGSCLYRTGDVVRTTLDRVLEYVGRADDQVKLRGFRIELGEIEAVLSAHDTVAQVAAVVVRDQLVAYVVAAAGRSIDAAEVTEFAARSLTAYMVPAVVMVLDRLPLTGSGKLDRKALPEPEFEARQFRAPATPVEETVASVFADVLGVDRVGRDDDFFALGGNSLLATQVAARLGAALDTTVPVRVLFDASTVESLAARVSGSTDAATTPLVAGPRPDRIPLSLAQQRMWFLNRLEPESAVNNIPLAIRLSGDLDVASLSAAIGDVLDRHESLRTVFPDVDGVGYQSIRPTADVATAVASETVAEAEIASRIEDLVTAGFDLTVDVPVRVRLFATSATEHVLVLVVHHIAADGFSMGPLIRDVMAAYAARVDGQLPAWAPLAVQYADYTLWQREVLGSEDDPESAISRQLGYWRQALAGLPDQLDLPTDRPRPAVAGYRGARQTVEVPAALQSAVVELARERGVTPFMVVHAALSVLLARLSGTSDIAVGTPVAGRGDAALDDVVGMFVNTLVLRTEVDAGSSFDELLSQVRSSDLAAFGHADVPFERLVEVLDPARSQSRHPLFQVMLTYQNLGLTAFELGGLGVSEVDFDSATAKFDLQVTVTESDSGALSIDLTYATDLFDADTMRVFGDRYLRILSAVTSAPSVLVGDIELLDDVERSRVVEEWNATSQPVPDATLVNLFEQQVARTPDATALVFEGGALSYGEFAARVHRTARFLIGEGVGPDSLVGLGMRRSLDLLVGMYAVLEAGGAYVPLDPDQPAERNGYILETANPALVLSTSREASDLPAAARIVELDSLDVSGFSDSPVADSDRVAPLRGSNVAYVIFTSGSTGRPKGVAVEHAAIVNRLVWMQAEYGLTAGDVVLQKTPFTFDVSVWEFFWPLQVGARLVVAAPDGHRDPAYLAKAMVDHGVTTAHFVPSMLSVFVAEPAVKSVSTLRNVFASGEALPAQTADRFRSISGAALHNLYGPTEAAVDVTFHEVTAADTTGVPIGAPVWNTQLFVLDGRLSPVPVGVPGELYLAGVQLARGYVGRSDLTADRFVANPFATNGSRMYRTGDLVSWNSAGELDYIGRTDFQVKLRGLRIELGEIETALLDRPEVSQSVVLVKNDQLVAYVVADDSFDADATKAALATSLASYMVPGVFVVLDEFPLNASGKLDRKALPEPVFESKAFRAPTTPTQEIVAGVIAEVLGLERVGLDDDFFALGGNSLLGTQVVSRLGAALDAQVPVRVLFEASTVEALAALVQSSAGGGARAALVAGPRPERIPLSLAQQRMWFLNRLDPESTSYNIPLAMQLTGSLDVGALHAALRDVLVRHESLRTFYPEDAEGPHQAIVAADDVEFDLTPVAVDASAVHRQVMDLVGQGFDVRSAVPLRAGLFRLDESTHVFAFVVHHISADGVSMAPMARDLVAAYAARVQGDMPQWAPLPVQYADYALWQREVLGSTDEPGSVAARQLEHWVRALAGAPDQLELPTDRVRPAVASMCGAETEFTIPAELHTALESLARAEGSSLFMVAHSALAVLLARLSGTWDVTVGTPVAGRGDAALDDLVGMFVNTLALRTELASSMTFTDVLARAKETDLSAFANADLPFERVVEAVSSDRSSARHPLFQTVLSFQNQQQANLALPGLTVSSVPDAERAAKFDLQLTLIPADSGNLEAILTYATDLFDEATVVTLGQRFVRILEAIVDDRKAVVGDIEIVSEDERGVLPGFSAPQSAAADPAGAVVPSTSTLPQVLATVVEADPEAPAISDDGTEISYSELDERSSRLARVLIAEGVGPGYRVPVALTRSADAVIAAWAVLKSGAALAPIDTAITRESFVSDLPAKVGITDSRYRDADHEGVEWIVLDDAADLARIEEQPGRPVSYSERTRLLEASDPAVTLADNSLVLSHGHAVALAERDRATYEVTYESRTVCLEPLTSIWAVTELLLAATTGAVTVVTEASDSNVTDVLADEWVTHAFVSNACAQALDVEELEDLDVLVLTDGEGSEGAPDVRRVVAGANAWSV